MIIIWKLTISTVRLGIPKFSKISFTNIADRNAVIKLSKSGKSNVEIAKLLDMNRSTVWKIVKKFQEAGKTLDRPGRGRKSSVRSPQLLKSTRENLRQNPRRSYRILATTAGVSKSTTHQVLRDDLGVKPFKMLHHQKLTANHVAMRAQKCRQTLPEMADGTMQNLVFTDEKKFDIQQVVNQLNDRVWASSSSTEERIVTRRQNPQYAMIWAGVTETGRFPLLFVPSGAKLNS